MAARYRKLPVVIEAMRFDGTFDGGMDISTWSRGAVLVCLDDVGRYLKIATLEGDMRAAPGDWIIRGVKGEFYPCKPDIFAATYEPESALVAGGEAGAHVHDRTDYLGHGWWRCSCGDERQTIPGALDPKPEGTRAPGPSFVIPEGWESAGPVDSVRHWCGFTMSSEHVYQDGSGYGCPECGPECEHHVAKTSRCAECETAAIRPPPAAEVECERCGGRGYTGIGGRLLAPEEGRTIAVVPVRCLPCAGTGRRAR